MLGCLVAGCASRQQQAAPIVKELHLTGNRALSDRQIQKKILTSATGWWPFAKKRLFDPVAWQADLKRIERLYVARGYYQAEVVSDEVKPKPPDGVALSAQISEGPSTHIGQVTIEGLEPVPADVRAKVVDDLPLKNGERFTEADWEAAKAQLGKRLRARGYAKAEVEGRALVDVKTHQAALTLFVTPGLALPLRGDQREGRSRRPHHAGLRLGAGAAGHRRRRALQRGCPAGGRAPAVRDGGVRERAGHRRGARRRHPAGGAARGGARRAVSHLAARRRRPRRSDPQRGAPHQRVDQPQLPGRHAQAEPAGRGGLGLHPERLRGLRREHHRRRRARRTDRPSAPLVRAAALRRSPVTA